MRYTRALWVLAAIISLGLSACGNSDKDGSISGMPPREADRLNAQRSQFESSDDPPFTADTHYSAGRLAESQGAAAQALQQYQSALKLDAKHRPTLYRLGMLHTQLRQYPQAVAAWEQYIAATGGDASGYSNLGYTYELAGDVNKAEEAYRKGIAADGRNEPCRVNFGLMLVRLGRVDEAEKQLGAVLPPGQVHYNIASVYEAMGQKAKARAEYQKAVELDPTLAGAKAKLAGLGE